MNDRAPKNSPFRFLDLPQELQDKIIEFHYSKRQITLTYKEDCTRRRALKLQNPVPLIVTSGFSLDLLYTNKHIYATARRILAKSPIHLHVRGGSGHGVEVLCFLADEQTGTAYSSLREAVTTLLCSGYDWNWVSKDGLRSMYDLRRRIFPNLQKFTLAGDGIAWSIEGPCKGLGHKLEIFSVCIA